jgi:hypothetical protein
VNCPTIDRLSQPDAWTDTERSHVETCARCAALLAEYRVFSAGDVRVSADEASRANARLSSFVDQITSEGAPSGQPLRASSSPARGGLLARFAEWCMGPQGRLAVGFAAVAIVAGVVFVPRALQGPQVGDTMRGSGAGSQPSAKAEPLTVTAGAAGACTVSWLAMPGAESYVVEVLDPLFAVVHSEHPGAALTCTLDANAIGSGTYVRVIALRQSDRILEQGPMALPGK